MLTIGAPLRVRAGENRRAYCRDRTEAPLRVERLGPRAAAAATQQAPPPSE